VFVKWGKNSTLGDKYSTLGKKIIASIELEAYDIIFI